MVTKYNPTNPDIHGFTQNNWNIIEQSNDSVHTFSDKPIIGFRRLPNLRDILTTASLSYPPQEIVCTLYEFGQMHPLPTYTQRCISKMQNQAQSVQSH